MRLLLHSEEHEGEPIHAPGGVVITPQARAVCLELPGRHGGLVWNRPTAVKVQDASGQESFLPVVDVTRQAQISILVSAFLSTLLWVGIIWVVRKLVGKR
jgi:hypothetical protein